MPQSALILRAQVLQTIRQFFAERGFLEVETPLRIPSPAPEAHIDPVPADGWFLQTSPEICMKRLLCRGHERIFQICRCWRAGVRGSRHLSEFTMLEWYRANSDYRELMADCEDLLRHVTGCGLTDGSTFGHNGLKIDPSPSWPRTPSNCRPWPSTAPIPCWPTTSACARPRATWANTASAPAYPWTSWACTCCYLTIYEQKRHKPITHKRQQLINQEHLHETHTPPPAARRAPGRPAGAPGWRGGCR